MHDPTNIKGTVEAKIKGEKDVTDLKKTLQFVLLKFFLTCRSVFLR